LKPVPAKKADNRILPQTLPVRHFPLTCYGRHNAHNRLPKERKEAVMPSGGLSRNLLPVEEVQAETSVFLAFASH
jgi:hypothetical protein